LALSLFIVIVFGFAGFWVNQLTQRENLVRVQAALNHATSNLANEVLQLHRMLLLCHGDAAFILAVQDQLPPVEAVEYTHRAIEKLALIKYAIPSAEDVFMYANGRDRIISYEGIKPISVFNQNLAARLDPTEELPDLAALAEGYHVFRSVMLYKMRVYSYGSLIVQISPQSFAGIGAFEDSFPDYRLIILDEHNRYVTSSYRRGGSALRGYDFTNFEGGARHTVLGENVYAWRARSVSHITLKSSCSPTKMRLTTRTARSTCSPPGSCCC